MVISRLTLNAYNSPLPTTSRSDRIAQQCSTGRHAIKTIPETDTSVRRTNQDLLSNI